ncbi:MAG: hypothetical protein KAR32_13005 [Candidatus Omnitrophica bacterium]|nr:hypothetical protein [Candidatus Omnitrophota bacterium]
MKKLILLLLIISIPSLAAGESVKERMQKAREREAIERESAPAKARAEREAPESKSAVEKTETEAVETEAVETEAVETEADEPVRSDQAKVDFYMVESCPYCRKIEGFFIRRNVAYNKYDIEKDKAAEKRYKALGAQRTPFTVIDGTAIPGYNLEAILKALKALDQ